MSSKSGFGTLTEILINNDAITKPNRNSVILLDGKNENTIYGISCGQFLLAGSLATSIIRFRLLIAGVKLSNVNEYINPSSNELPQSFSSSQIYLNRYITGSFPNIELDFTNGVYIPKGIDVSIILTFAETNFTAMPNSDSVISTLSVYGISGKEQAVFKNLR